MGVRNTYHITGGAGDDTITLDKRLRGLADEPNAGIALTLH